MATLQKLENLNCNLLQKKPPFFSDKLITGDENKISNALEKLFGNFTPCMAFAQSRSIKTSHKN